MAVLSLVPSSAVSALRSAWISDACILVSGRLVAPLADRATDPESGAPRVLVYDAGRRFLAAWESPDGTRALPDHLIVAIDVTVTRRQVIAGHGPFTDLLLDGPAGAELEDREAILRFLRVTGEVRGDAPDDALVDSLYTARELLRNRGHVGRQGTNPDIVPEGIWRIDARTFCLTGWLPEELEAERDLVAVSPEGGRSRVEGLRRYPRPDLDARLGHPPAAASGFLAILRLESPSFRIDGWLIESSRGGDVPAEHPVPAVTAAYEVRRKLLALLMAAPEDTAEQLLEHIKPALLGLQARLRESVVDTRVDTFGDPPSDAATTWMYILDDDAHILEHLLARAVCAPEPVDLLFVVDGAEHAATVRRAAAELHPLFDVPFRLVTVPSRVGGAAALDCSVVHATGRTLLVQTPRCMPDGDDWIEKLRAGLDVLPPASVVSPAVIDPAGGSDEDTASGDPDVPGECFMVSTRAFRDAGGFICTYATLAFEAADLAARLREAGGEMCRAADVCVARIGDPAADDEEEDLHRSDARLWTHLHPEEARREPAVAQT